MNNFKNNLLILVTMISTVLGMYLITTLNISGVNQAYLMISLVLIGSSVLTVAYYENRKYWRKQHGIERSNIHRDRYVYSEEERQAVINEQLADVQQVEDRLQSAEVKADLQKKREVELARRVDEELFDYSDEEMEGKSVKMECKEAEGSKSDEEKFDELMNKKQAEIDNELWKLDEMTEGKRDKLPLTKSKGKGKFTKEEDKSLNDVRNFIKNDDDRG